MNKELYENYVEGFVKDYWNVQDKMAFHHKAPAEWVYTQDVLEIGDGGARNAISTYNSEEFQEALKTWDTIKNSPLVKALA